MVEKGSHYYWKGKGLNEPCGAVEIKPKLLLQRH